jgi:hypothetical protein
LVKKTKGILGVKSTQIHIGGDHNTTHYNGT